MKIEHFGGIVDVSDGATIDGVLSQRFGDGWNEYLVSGDTRFPYLAVLVGVRGACIHYFPEEGHPGFRSVVAQSVGDELVEFRTNRITEPIEVPSDAVVPVAAARAVVAEFLQEPDVLPDCVDWLEL